MNSKAIRRCAIYVRISLDVSGERLGVQRQLEDCQALAVALGWTVVQVYEDNDLSASKAKVVRPAYERMMADFEAGRIDALIVYDLDRLTRKPAELETFIDAADRLRLQLANVSGDVDLATASGRMIARIKGAVARQEAERIGERIARRAQQLAESGVPHGGRRRAFGYTKGWKIIPVEAALVREAYERALAGETVGSVVRDWNVRGEGTVTGSVWRRASLADMLKNPLYAGLRQWKKAVIGQGTWEAIIDEGTYRRYLQANTERMAGRDFGTNTRKHLLSGIAKCGVCGTGMSTNRLGNGRRNLTCRKENLGCGKVARNYQPVEDQVVELFLLDSERESVKTTVGTGRDYGGELAALQRQIDELQASFQANRLELEDYITFVEPVRAEKRAVLIEQSKTEGVRTRRITDLRARWQEPDAMTVQERRLMLSDRISGVVILPVAPEQRGSTVYDPSLVRIFWRHGESSLPA